MRTTYLVLFSVVTPMIAQNQLFTFGVKGGVPAETPLGQTGHTPFVLGPTVSLRIYSRLSIETGVMFHRLGQDASTGAFPYPADAFTVTYNSVTARALEVPILAKVQVLGERRTWRPFFTLGPTVRRTSVESQYAAAIFSGTTLGTTTVHPGINSNRVDWRVDPALGVGVECKAGRFHLDPEARYSYWGAGANLPVRKNQVDFLLGFRF
jgi:hypothetical protein